MSQRTLVASAALLLLAACAATPETPQPPAGQHIGRAFQTLEPVAFAVVDADPAAYYDKTVLVEATITSVCQSMGCWMQIEDQGKTAMVRWESGCGGEFAFPKDAAGKRVWVQGSFYPKTISEGDAAHMEEESGGTLKVAREGYEFNSNAVLVLAD